MEVGPGPPLAGGGVVPEGGGVVPAGCPVGGLPPGCASRRVERKFQNSELALYQGQPELVGLGQQ